MTASPAKIKAYLAAIKGRFLDDSGQGTTLCIHESYLGVLKMELLLRGVLAQEDDQLRGLVQSSVGKMLLVEQQFSPQVIPKPLLAGANVMAGRVAEAYYHNLLSLQFHRENEQHQASIYGPSFSKDDAAAALQRAKDIQDERWLILLQTPSVQSPSADSNPDTSCTSTSAPLDILEVALGYYTTAALIQSDTPPMWKKVWDVWILLNDASKASSSVLSSPPAMPAPPPPPFEAQVAIENLARIALSKGNTKRGSELQLRLIQSYLNTNRTTLTQAPLMTDRQPSNSSSTSKANIFPIAKYFGDSLISSTQLSSPRTPAMDQAMADKARATLGDCQSYFESVFSPSTTWKQADDEVNNSGTDDTATTVVLMEHPDALLFQVLRVQVGIAVEEANIKMQADENFQTDRNRSVANANLNDCLTKARESWVLATNAAFVADDTLLQEAQTLRDCLMTTWGSDSSSAQDEENDSSSSRDYEANQYLGFHWVHQSILRLQCRAEIISHKTGSYFEAWDAVLQYILPILKEINRQVHSEAMADPMGQADDENGEVTVHESGVQTWLGRSTHPEGDFCGFKKNMIASAVSILPRTLWMLIAVEEKLVPATLARMDKELRLSVSILTSLIHQQQLLMHLDRQSEKDSTVGSKNQSASMQSISQWRQARKAALCMVCQDDDSEIYHITKDAIASSKRKEHGGYWNFLQCMVAWSGWYHRPWQYCTNSSDARGLLISAMVDIGRPLSTIEESLLELASADAELINGGFIETAYKQYGSVLDKFQETGDSTGSVPKSLLRAHCLNGMARIKQIREGGFKSREDEGYARKNLNDLSKVEIASGVPLLCIWHRQSIFSAAKAFQLNVARQLVADLLIRSGNCEDARLFLETAVRDSPNDFDAAFALGAFLLRMAFYSGEERNPAGDKNAQINLLKAAKLDPSKANPFALLGVWFEDQGDYKRAKGCFTKSLDQDPCNPIAGRGLLRLLPREGHRDVLEAAINTNSPLNGWAWHSVGLSKAFVDGEDELAAIAILKGLRCRDIASPENENLSIFYNTPQSTSPANEKSVALADVATCYRRLGRFTASIRAFHASIDSAAGLVPSTVLISCAQVELELGLFDDAVRKFESVLGREGSTDHPIASYGHASALLAIAERDLGDGKSGSAYCNTLLAIESCLKAATKFGCTWKLLGDLYTMGATFPPSVFTESAGVTSGEIDDCAKRQLMFVAKGEEAYRSCLNTQTFLSQVDDDDATTTKSSIQCDIATNTLLQAQISSSGGVGDDTPLGNDLYDRAATAFRNAIESNPLHSASWCGLGCAVLYKDPLLAQHAFCRSVQLDKMFPDAYANIGFLYTSKYAFSASMSIMEALTQVADTPMMWMNCAFMLEREAERCLNGTGNIGPEGHIVRAADAYRAALQVMKHPDAQLGLSLTCRVKKSNSSTERDLSNVFSNAVARKDSSSLMKEYIGASCRTSEVADIFQGVMLIEKSVEASHEAKWRDEIFLEGKEMVMSTLRDREDCFTVQTTSLRPIVDQTDVDDERAITLDSQLKKESLQRQILCQPDRADLWISLSKEFVRDDALEAAFDAASRASDMLARKLSNPHQISGQCTSVVNAKHISEAISLEVWLKKLKRDGPSGGGENSDSYSLQRALLMNPGNILARRGLVQESNSSD